jgi:hypothetical protein
MRARGSRRLIYVRTYLRRYVALTPFVIFFFVASGLWGFRGLLIGGILLITAYLVMDSRDDD